MPRGRRKKEDVDQIIPEVEKDESSEKKVRYCVKLKDPNSFLNLRKGAGADKPSIGRLHEGDIVEPLEDEKNGWIKIEFDGKTGFVLSSRLALV